MTTFDGSRESLRVSVQAALYNERVLHKCFYWYAGDYEVDIDLLEPEKRFLILLRPKSGQFDSATLEALERRIRQDLIDFKTRDIVATETRTIRELLIAKAFAHSDDLDQPPPGDVADPIGFTPHDYESETRKEI